MKGTLAILGLLFAAYAAPLFGNEVPLILDETIQLPVGTPMWDVVPTRMDGFYWIAAHEHQASMTTVYYGNTMWMTSDTAGQYRGIPLAMSGFLSANDELCMALSTNLYYDLEQQIDTFIALDTSWTRFENLLTGEPVATTKVFPG